MLVRKNNKNVTLQGAVVTVCIICFNAKLCMLYILPKFMYFIWFSLIVTELDGLWIVVRFVRRTEVFLFSKISRPTLTSTQPPIRWVSCALSSGTNDLRREANHLSPYSAAVKNAWSYTSTPSTASNILTGTTLLLWFMQKSAFI